MSKTTLEKLTTVMNQGVGAGVIMDDTGNVRGRILIRYTKSQIGYNHEVNIISPSFGVCWRDVEKGSCYRNPVSLHDLLERGGSVCLDHMGEEMSREDVESRSQFHDIHGIKNREGKRFSIYWVL